MTTNGGPTSASADRGFILPEAMAALAILSLIVVALIDSFQAIRADAERWRTARIALRVAQDKLATAIADHRDGRAFPRAGRTQEGLRWRVEVFPHREPNDRSAPVSALIVSVEPGPGRAHPIRLTTFVLDPSSERHRDRP